MGHTAMRMVMVNVKHRHGLKNEEKWIKSATSSVSKDLGDWHMKENASDQQKWNI